MNFFYYKGSHFDPVLEVVDRLTEHRGGLLVVADPGPPQLVLSALHNSKTFVVFSHP